MGFLTEGRDSAQRRLYPRVFQNIAGAARQASRPLIYQETGCSDSGVGSKVLGTSDRFTECSLFSVSAKNKTNKLRGVDAGHLRGELRAQLKQHQH